MIEPRQYQIEAVDAVLAKRDEGITRQLLSLPTGTGKTIVFSLLAKRLNTRTLILAHREELLAQAKAKMRLVWPEASIGICKAETDEIDAQVVIGSIQTVCREKRLERLKAQGFDLLIIDEAHHSASDSYVDVIQGLGFMGGDKLLIGVTATPGRGDGVGLYPIFEEIVFERSLASMVYGGYLSPLRGMQVFTRTNLKGVATHAGDFATGDLAERVNTSERNQLIVDSFQKLGNDRKRAIAYCVDVQHAIDLANAFNDSGVPSAAVYGSMDNDARRQALDDFRSGKHTVLTNCQLLTEGFDEAQVDCVMIARPTKSEGLYVQMIGRGTRLHPAKTDCLVIDFTDACRRHQLCSYKNVLDGDLPRLLRPEPTFETDRHDGMDERVIVQPGAGEFVEGHTLRIDNEFVGEIDFFSRSAFAWIQTGDAWHLRVSSGCDFWVRGSEEEGYRAIAHVNGELLTLVAEPIPLVYAIGICEEDVRRFFSSSTLVNRNASWRVEAPTDKQIDLLKKIGLQINPQNYTRGQLAEVIDQKLVKAPEPATAKQRWKLQQLGIDVPDGVTKAQAWRLIKENVMS